jgi:DNA-binding transcriptional ArsR family regulator
MTKVRHQPGTSAHTGKSGAPPLQPTVAEMRALAHPLRLRILELFAERAGTTKQVADLLGQPPTRLYHHVASLERAGLLVLKETRKNRGTVEKWYEAAAKSFGPTPSARGPGRPKGSAARRAVATTVLELSRQELVLAMQQRGHDRALVARIVVTADPERLAVLRKRLYRAVQDIHREFGRGDNRVLEAGNARWAVTLTFAPASMSGVKRGRG